MKSAMHPIAEVDAAIALAEAMGRRARLRALLRRNRERRVGDTARVDVGKCPKMRARSTMGPKVQ